MPRNDERVLILAPTGQDAPLICEQLRVAGITAEISGSLEAFAAATLEGAATGLIAEEALTPDGVQRLIEALSAQPAWSDLPLTILTNSDIYSDREKGNLIGKLTDS